MEILTELERRKIPTLALTKLFTGKFGLIEDFTEWRLKEFQTLNLDFNKLTPIKGEMLIEELHIGCGIPTLKEGVILTANADKGEVLKHILRQKNYYPKSIIFVDDILLWSVDKIYFFLSCLSLTSYHQIISHLMSAQLLTCST